MRPILLAVALASTLGLLGCGDDSTGATSSGDGGGPSGSGGSAPAGGGGDAATTTTSATASQGTGVGGAGGGSTVDPSASAPLAEGVRLDRLVALQVTSVPLMENDGLAAPPEPIVAGRDLWIRGFLSGSGAPVRLEVVVATTDGAAVFTSTAAAPAVGLDDDPTTTPITFIPASAVRAGATFSARVVRDDAPLVAPGGGRDERYPRDGSLATLPAVSVPPLALTLLPFRWDADGTGRLPDTSPAALETIRALFLARYPVADVAITVHDVIPYDRGLDFGGDVDFGDVNDLLYDLRASEAPPAAAYWYGMLKPADSFDDYCFGTCTTGQSYVADDPEDDDLRVGAGVAFNPEDGAATAVHEVGHMFGRYHAPCYVNSWDPDYPYADGAIGVLGWDARAAVALDPYETTDFMGYCDPQGTSDYTFAALAERASAVSMLSFSPRPARRGAARITCSHAP